MTDVPTTMKRDNWILFRLARSHDPSLKIFNTRELVSALINTMYLIGEHKYDDLLVESKVVASMAMMVYEEDKKNVDAVLKCENILDKIGFILYDKTYSSPEAGGFGSTMGASTEKVT